MDNRGDKAKGSILFLIMLAIVLLAMGTIFVLHLQDEKKKEEAQERYEQLLEQAVAESDKPIENPDKVPESVEQVQTSEQETEVVEEENFLPNDRIDFDYLWTQNQDIVAWIEIPGTEVNYPILCSEDNEYYLLHNLDGSKGYPGCIYMETYNATDFRDPLTVLYGHNMKNGTMFGSLKKFQKEDFFNSNKELDIYLPDRMYKYELLAVSQYNDEHLLGQDFAANMDGGYTFTGMQGNEGTNFWEKLKQFSDNKAIFSENQKLTEDDQFLVLSTCLGNPNKRLLVVYKRV